MKIALYNQQNKLLNSRGKNSKLKLTILANNVRTLF